MECSTWTVYGIEFIETVDGRVVTYDVNTNTNYNAGVEAGAPLSAPREPVRYLDRLAAPGRQTVLA